MSSINQKLGLKPAGRRKSVLNRLSGVACPKCPHRAVTEGTLFKGTPQARTVRRCGYCGYQWDVTPTLTTGGGTTCPSAD